jgi:CheY-like chemotaxis protein
MNDANETADGRGLDVVVVDDNADGAEMLADVLAEYGCNVRVATLGLEAIRLLEDRCPDLLFLDLGMPEIDGYEVARAVRHRYGNTIRVVAVTGFDTYEARELARWSGFDAFISKPYKPQQVQAALRESTPVSRR